MPNEILTGFNGKKITEIELYEKLPELATGRTLVAYFTDRADCVSGISVEEVNKLLELRAFNETGEFYAFRSLTDEPFICRSIDDGGIPADDETHMLETHYLDIDADRTYNPDQKENGGWYEYQTMTGGVYHLPIRNADRVLLCNYITYDNAESIAQVCDYRFVKFLSEGEQTQ